MERRAFLGWLVSGVTAWPLRGVRLHAQAAALPEGSVATLRAMAAVVLPSELTAAGHDKVVSDFVQWLASYQSGAERSWGYGAPRKSATPAIDSSRYATQLRDLDARAKAHATTFAAATVTTRSAIVREVLASAPPDLPGAPSGQHIVTDFMSFFFTSGPAYDLAYGASVRRGTCRGLNGATGRPERMVVGD